MNGFDNMALCLYGGKLVGGLAFMTDFQKNYLSAYSKMMGVVFTKNNHSFQFLQDLIMVV